MSERLLPLLVANHKANKTWDEVAIWIDEVAALAQSFEGTVIFCPSYPFLAAAYEKISKNGINIKLGAQNISRFGVGAHTGEVAASQIADIVEFVIIGHSERRSDPFNENNDVLKEKVSSAKKAGLEPIYCVRDPEDKIPDGVSIVAYEPPSAIGSNNPEPAERVKDVIDKIKSQGDFKVLYGGSVSSENIGSYLKIAGADGVLVGATNSLDPQKFIGIIKALE